MPSIKKIRTKSGLSFKITVSCGYDERYRKRCHFKTWKAPENWSEQRAEREAQKVAYEFENSIKLGFQQDVCRVCRVCYRPQGAYRHKA